MSRWRITLGLLLIALTAGALACGGNSAGGPSTEAAETVQGFLQEVKSISLLELESLTLVDDKGTRWTFESHGRQVEGFTPSHLREHMVLGLPVIVTFHRGNGSLVINDITD